MAFDITKNQIITVTRGDTFSMLFYINLGDWIDPIIYDMQEGDRVYLAIMEPNQPFEHAIVRKMFTCDDFDYEEHAVNINFKSTDTEYLMPGPYYYMIKLVRPGEESGDGEQIDTLVSKTKMFIID